MKTTFSENTVLEFKTPGILQKKMSSVQFHSFQMFSEKNSKSTGVNCYLNTTNETNCFCKTQTGLETELPLFLTCNKIKIRTRKNKLKILTCQIVGTFSFCLATTLKDSKT